MKKSFWLGRGLYQKRSSDLLKMTTVSKSQHFAVLPPAVYRICDEVRLYLRLGMLLGVNALGKILWAT
jgi:hypothetical protein